MNGIFQFTLIAIVPIFLYGCELLPERPALGDTCTGLSSGRSGTLAVEQIQTSIIGKWEWQCSIIMDRGIHPPNNVKTPRSSGYTEQREFLSDGHVRFYRNKKLTGTYPFEIRRIKVSDAEYEAYIYIDSNAANVYIESDTLVYGNGASDGADHRFVRMR